MAQYNEDVPWSVFPLEERIKLLSEIFNKLAFVLNPAVGF